MGAILFVDVRDRYGVTQVVVRDNDALVHEAKKLRTEMVIGVVGAVDRRSADTVNPKLDTGEVEVVASEVRLLNDAKRPPFSIADEGAGHRGSAAPLPLPRSAPAGHAGAPDPAAQGVDGDPQVLRRGRLHRGRDADPHQVDAGGRARLPGAEPRPRRPVLRPAAVAAAVQAAADDRRHGSLLPDRALLPRRGSARRPPAGVHPGRRRDLVRHAGHRLRPDRAGDQGRLRRDRRRRAAAAAADAVQRGDGQLRLRQAGPALRHGDRRT